MTHASTYPSLPSSSPDSSPSSPSQLTSELASKQPTPPCYEKLSSPTSITPRKEYSLEDLTTLSPPFVNLSLCNISDANVHLLINALKKVPKTFTNIDLMNNHITAKGLAGVLSVVQRSKIRVLHLKNNPIGAEGAHLLATQFLPGSTELRVLGLGGCSIGDSAAIKIIKCLESCCPKLTELYLWDTRIGSAALVYVARLLDCSSTLKVLHIGHNNFSDEPSFAVFVEALTCNTSLRELGLQMSRLTNVSIKTLCEYLKTNKTLELLDFWGNPIDDASAQLFAAVLRTNQALKTIRMVTCTLSDTGAAQIVTALEKNTCITELKLPDTVPQRLKGRAERYISRNNVIASLGVSDAEKLGSIVKYFNCVTSQVDKLEQELENQSMLRNMVSCDD